METITSRQNPLFQKLRKLNTSASFRRQQGLFLCEGPKLLEEAIKWDVSVQLAVKAPEFSFPEALSCRKVETPADVLRSLADTETPQGVAFACELPDTALPDRLEKGRYLVLDGVQDPGNVGTIWRTADAAGFQALLAGAGSADLMSPKVQRSAMGSGFRVPFVHADNLAETLVRLREKGWHVIASDLKGTDFYARGELGDKFVLVIGNEARGISDAVREAADVRLKLPMRGGAESLNAAVAAGIMMYELMRGK